MEKGGWLAAFLALVALAVPVIALVLVRGLGLGFTDSPALVRGGMISEAVIDPVRASLGVGLALLFVGFAVLVIRRTDWSLSEA
jgi:hypothetical protein